MVSSRLPYKQVLQCGSEVIFAHFCFVRFPPATGSLPLRRRIQTNLFADPTHRPFSRRSIVTASFRPTLPHHIPQEGLLSSSSPVYAIQFGNSTRFIIVERSRSVCQGGRGSTCFCQQRWAYLSFPPSVRGSITLSLLPASFLVSAFIAKKDQRASSFALWSFYSLMNDSAIYSFGPAATSAFPASLPVYLPKFLINLPAKSFAFSSHSEAF